MADAKRLHDLVIGKLGAAVRPATNPGVAQLGVTIGTVLPNNPNRVAALIVNLSTANLYLTPVGAPSTSNGVRLGPNGGQLSMVWDEDFDVVGYQWDGLADAPASNIYVLEYLIDAG